MYDIAIAVGLSMLTLFTAYLGVHVTMHPAETSRSKWGYKIAFGVCGVAICSLIGLQARRSGVMQQSLIDELKRIDARELLANTPITNPPLVVTRSPFHKNERNPPKAQQQPPTIQQHSEGSCSPNIVGNNNSPTCVPEPVLTATQQLQQKTATGEWLTSFTVSSNVLAQTGSLKLLCDGPVLRAGISRINPAEFMSGVNGPNPTNPNEAVYDLGPEMLSPGTAVVIGVYSVNPVRVLSGSLGNQVIRIRM